MKAFGVYVVFIFCVGFAVAQTDDMCLSVKKVLDPERVQGYPGKRGVTGLPWPTAPLGQSEFAKEYTCNESDIIMLHEKVRQLTEQINKLREESEDGRISLPAFEELASSLFRGRPSPEEGWFTPENGYQYILTNTSQSWNESRRLCQGFGGDLAAVGLRNYKMRSVIGDVVRKEYAMWIGLSAFSAERTFEWVDGIVSTPENTHWRPNEPNDRGGNEDCVEMRGDKSLFKSNDRRCSYSLRALCAKRLG